MKTIFQEESQGKTIWAPAGIDAVHECLDLPTQYLARAKLARGDVIGYLELFKPSHRFAAYWEISLSIPDRRRVQVLRDIWDEDDVRHTNSRAWRSELLFAARHPHWFMTPYERISLQELSRPLTIYRGADPAERIPKGFAWSFDRTDADFCAFFYARYGPPSSGYVFRAWCDPRHALAYLIRFDGSDELLILPEKVRDWEQLRSREIVASEEHGVTTWRVSTRKIHLPGDAEQATQLPKRE